MLITLEWINSGRFVMQKSPKIKTGYGFIFSIIVDKKVTKERIMTGL